MRPHLIIVCLVLGGGLAVFAQMAGLWLVYPVAVLLAFGGGWLLNGRSR